MNILLLKDVPNLGLAGQVKNVTEGYARNFLFPKKLAKAANAKDVENFKVVAKRTEHDTAIAGSRLAVLADQIRNMHATIEKKVHDDNKLYGSVSAEEVYELLKGKGLSINKKQIEFNKAIRATGEHKVIIKLSSKVKPELTLKVVATKGANSPKEANSSKEAKTPKVDTSEEVSTSKA